jgi:dihydrofolate reductase
MGRLIYSAIASLDGYVADEHGGFEWAAPDEEVHAYVNELERPVGTYLYGRRMYETMAVWETDRTLASASAVTRDFAEVWRAADKVVYSRTLTAASTERTRIRREFDPADVADLKAVAPRDISVGGPHLAGQAIEAGLVDEIDVFVTPVAVGAGKPALPVRGLLALELVDERRFGSGVVHLRYRPRTKDRHGVA